MDAVDPDLRRGLSLAILGIAAILFAMFLDLQMLVQRALYSGSLTQYTPWAFAIVGGVLCLLGCGLIARVSLPRRRKS